MNPTGFAPQTSERTVGPLLGLELLRLSRGRLVPRSTLLRVGLPILRSIAGVSFYHPALRRLERDGRF